MKAAAGEVKAAAGEVRGAIILAWGLIPLGAGGRPRIVCAGMGPRPLAGAAPLTLTTVWALLARSLFTRGFLCKGACKVGLLEGRPLTTAPPRCRPPLTGRPRGLATDKGARGTAIWGR